MRATVALSCKCRPCIECNSMLELDSAARPLVVNYYAHRMPKRLAVVLSSRAC